MNYLEKQIENIKTILTQIENVEKSGDTTGLVIEYDGIKYSIEEAKILNQRATSRIDGYYRLNQYIQNNIWETREVNVIKALATKEFDYFLEVENALDSFTIEMLLNGVKDGEEQFASVFDSIQTLNKKISMRSSMSFKAQWIEDRKYELASVINFKDVFLYNEDSYESINCLDYVLSGKISKQELVDADYWIEPSELRDSVKLIYNGYKSLNK